MLIPFSILLMSGKISDERGKIHPLGISDVRKNDCPFYYASLGRRPSSEKYGRLYAMLCHFILSSAIYHVDCCKCRIDGSQLSK